MGDLHGAFAGETFWCHVSGQALNRAAPHEAGIWTFEDLGSRRAAKAELTPREREVAAQLMKGLTSKEIGRALGISHARRIGSRLEAAFGFEAAHRANRLFLTDDTNFSGSMGLIWRPGEQ